MSSVDVKSSRGCWLCMGHATWLLIIIVFLNIQELQLQRPAHMPKGKYDFHLKKKKKNHPNNYCTALPINKNDNSQRYKSLKVRNSVQGLYQKGKWLSCLGSGYPSGLFLQCSLECAISLVL